MNKCKLFLVILSIICVLIDADACNFSIIEKFGKCIEKIETVVRQADNCKNAEKIISPFSRSANLTSETLCDDITKILEIALMNDIVPLNIVTEIVEYCGVVAWGYLSTRSLLKQLFPSIKQHDILQSSFQRFLSDERTAFIMTFPCVFSFISLALDDPLTSLIISLLGSGIPAIFGTLQFCFDCFWKIPRFLFKKCGKCTPTREEKLKEQRKLSEYLVNEREKINKEIEKLNLEEEEE